MAFYGIFSLRPLLKVIDNLLVMGELSDDDLIYVLRLIDPEAFDDHYVAGIPACHVTFCQE